MLGELKSEIEELRKEMELLDNSKRNSGTNDIVKVNYGSVSRTELISEMGDILFDTLMLEMTIRR